MSGPYRFEQLGRQHNRDDFSSGVEALDRYLKQQASQDQRRSVAVPYVLIETATEAVVGFYTLSTYTVVRASLPDDISQRLKLPLYREFPAFLIGRLAVDRRYQDQGFGRRLLMDALSRCKSLSQHVGALGVIVDAKNDNARAFYERLGFLRLIDHDHRLIIPITVLNKLGL